MTLSSPAATRRGVSSWRRLLQCLVVIGAFCSFQALHAETKLDFWHSYIHQPGGVVHYSFQIASYKRGLFFGSCGPSTRSLQWEYDIDLAGPGPVYQTTQISITSDLKKVQVDSGSISVDAARDRATIRLRVKSAAGTSEFIANGTHLIKKIK